MPTKRPSLTKELLGSVMCAATIAGTWILLFVFMGVTTLSAIIAAILADLLRIVFSFMVFDK